MRNKLTAIVLSGMMVLNLWIPAMQAEANVNIGDTDLDIQEGVEDWVEGDTGLEEVPGGDFDAWLDGRSGKCGPASTWLLSESGTLTIGGSGSVTDTSGYMAKKDKVKELIIEDKITSLCEEAFCGLENLTVITIKNKDCTIHDDANTFSEATAISGYVNSTAHKYAEKYNREFICIEHMYGEWKSDALSHWKECVGCHERKNVVAHEWKWILDKEATQEQNGLKHEECKVCGRVQNESTVIEKLPHIHNMKKVEAVVADCENNGNIEYYICETCDKIYADAKGNLEIAEEEIVVDKLGHDYTATVTESTVTSEGYTTYTCIRCTHSYKDNYTEPLKDLAGFGEEDAYRISGPTRYQTAFKIADALKTQMDVDKFDTVIVAYGEKYADALAGSYLAAKKAAPILLVKPEESQKLVDYVSENLVPGGKIYILGGTAVIDSRIENQLKSYGDVERLSGRDRYVTNLEILKEAGVSGEEILVCTGTGFADSLSASALGRPILLVNKKLNDDQKKYLKGLTGNKCYIIGGNAAVSENVENEMVTYCDGVERLGGKDRYKTSILVAERFFDSPSTVVLAYAKNFPDGLSGGPLAISKNAPLILTETEAKEDAVTYVNKMGIGKGAVLGGNILISDDAVRNILKVEKIVEWK